MTPLPYDGPTEIFVVKFRGVIRVTVSLVIIRSLIILSAVLVFVLSGCDANRRESTVPLSMQVIVLNASQVPDNDQWKGLVGRPIIALEYTAHPESATGAGRSLYLYDGRTGECRTVIEAPSSPGDPMLIGWAPCK
jgi:hypothetical protein